MAQVALFLVAKCLAVADEKFKITRIRLIEPRIVNFINDAMAEGEPEAAASGIGGSETFLCAGRPTRLNSGCPKRRAIDLWVHGQVFCFSRIRSSIRFSIEKALISQAALIVVIQGTRTASK